MTSNEILEQFHSWELIHCLEKFYERNMLEMMHCAEQMGEGEMSALKRQIIAVVGDCDRTLTNQIIEAVGNGSTVTAVNLDTKYYQARVGILRFRTGSELLRMKRDKPDVMVGAIILKLDSKHDLETMENVVQEVDCDSHVLVADCCSSDCLNFAQSWAHSFNFELVILNPNKSQREEAMSLSEKCGIARVIEVIESVPWRLRRENFKKVTGKEELDRLLTIIETMSDSSEDSSAEPDDEDREAIWQAFSSYGLQPSSPHAPTLKECEEEISVDVTIVRNQRESDKLFSELLENKAKIHHGEHYCSTPSSTDFNLFQAMKDTRDANMKSNDAVQRVDSATALLSKIVDLKMMNEEVTYHQKID